MKIDVVIVNWNSGLQLQECVNSVRAHHSGLVGKCIVVDNGSSDESGDFLHGASDVELVRTGKNLGFGKACNLGATGGSAEFVLFLNPDAKLLPNSLAGALTVMLAEGNESVGIVSVQLIGEDGAVQRTCARFPTPFLMMAKSIGLASVIGSLNFHMHNWEHSETKIVDHVIGAFYLIRRSLFIDTNGFDERFFVYLEDLDLSYRASERGYHSLFIANVQAFHKGGGVSEQVKAHRLFYSLRSRILYSFKHFKLPSAVLVAFATLVIEPVSRLMLLLLRGRASEVRDLAYGYKMLWGWVFTDGLRG